MGEIEKGYSIVQTADLLGVKPRTIRMWIKDNKIIAKKITGLKRWIIMESEIRRLQGNDKK